MPKPKGTLESVVPGPGTQGLRGLLKASVPLPGFDASTLALLENSVRISARLSFVEKLWGRLPRCLESDKWELVLSLWCRKRVTCRGRSGRSGRTTHPTIGLPRKNSSGRFATESI